MYINYQEELLRILETNKLATLPSQAVIDSDERFARAVWKNLKHEGDYRHGDFYPDSFPTWYEKANWGKILQKYSENTKLWEELLAIKFEPRSYYAEIKNTSYDFILSPMFQKDYPIIAEHFLTNNDKLIDLFNKTQNKEFFNRLTLDLDKKEDVFKLFLINSSNNIDEELIKKYENDDKFVIKLLNKSVSNFAYLNEENRAKRENIKIALKGDRKNFYLLSNENKERYFTVWATHYIKDFNLKEILKFESHQQEFILSQRADLLAGAIQNKDRELYKIAVDCLKANLNNVINSFDEASLRIFAKNKDNLKEIEPQLEKFVNDYKGSIGKKEDKMMFLVSFNYELKEKLQTNIFYQINKILEIKEKQDRDWFEYIMKKVSNLYNSQQINDDDAKILTGKAKSCLTIDVMKELRIPKENSFDYVRTNVLGLLSNEELLVRKPKI